MKSVTRKSVKREIRTSRASNAQQAIGKIEPGCEVFLLTFGQFSLMDAITTILDQTGPADVTISTWTAATADLDKSSRLLEKDEFRTLRFLVDRSFVQRQPRYCAKMRKLFGDDSIRTARLHSKFVTINNERWTIAIRTSMNLNSNPRMENLEISDSPELNGYLLDVVDQAFAQQEPGVLNGDLPELNNEEFGTPAIEAGKMDIAAIGYATATPAAP